MPDCERVFARLCVWIVSFVLSRASRCSLENNMITFYDNKPVWIMNCIWEILVIE